MVTQVSGKEGATTGAKAHKTCLREECERLVKGKSVDEVMQLIGRPEQTDRMRTEARWIYPGLTYDSVTGKRDRKVNVYIDVQRKVVTGVQFIS